ncbi:hypothetical protein CAEBREN_10420 [Caenorhabditis brenneri]|uniref:SCP domain-containing protein n=1 Tax=Caenorhabditis brenneri TaxID=135651 RepID=G0P659_CAEBE|nr:hypothetical protein CAEBREN_10420 [Caenorhabditis brenneri]
MKFSLICLALLCAGATAFSAEGQAAIVKAHNDLRSSIAKGAYVAKGTQQPAASDMLKMSWDDTIAQSAQQFAEGCPNDHSKNEYGENLYWGWDSEAIGNLDPYKEFQDYGWLSRTLDQATYDTGIGHATQMVWSKTNLIGCGAKNCGVDPKNGMNKVTVVCQYKTKGNTIDEKIYTEGTSCSTCPSGSSCETNSGLCA